MFRKQDKWLRSHRIVLAFHGLGNPSVYGVDFDPEMWICEQKFEYLLDHLPAGVLITFDDGFLSCVSIALPALTKRNLVASFFVTYDRLGKKGFLERKDLQTLLKAGMHIGTHGMKHRPWMRLSEEILEEEIFDAKRKLETVTGCAITEAACPFGAYDRRSLKALRRSGIERLYTSDRLPARLDRWLVPRYTVRRSDDEAQLSRVLSYGDPVLPWLRQARVFLKQWR